MGTPLVWQVRIKDLTTGNVVALGTGTQTSGEVFTPGYTRKRSAAGTITFGVRPGNALCNAIIAAWGGPTYQNAPLMYLAELSHNGGATWITAGWVEKGRVVLSGPELGAVVDGPDIADGFNRSYIDHVTFVGVPAGAVLDGAPGTIPLGQGGGALIQPGGRFPYLHGFFDQNLIRASLPGAALLLFSVISDPAIANQPISTDVNSDSIFRAAANVLAAASATYNPGQPALFGAHQHFAVDIPNRKILAGHVGMTPVLTLTGKLKPDAVDETTQAAIVEIQPSTIEPNLSAMFAQIEIIGGASSHNMPDGGKFTSLVVINTSHDAKSVNWYDSLCVLGVSTGNGGGGVFFWPHDGALHPMSGLMDVHDLAYDAAAGRIYAATSRGVFYRAIGYDAKPWTRLGGLDLDCAALWIPATGVVYVLVNGTSSSANSAVNGLYRFPQVAGEPDTTNSGYAGWTYIVTSGTILAAAGTDAALYYVDTEAPDTITLHQSGKDDPNPIPTSRGEHIVGMDLSADASQIWVRTEAGAAGFYTIAVGSTGPLLDANPAGVGPGGLADSFGPLATNSLLRYVGAINSQPVGQLVATDRGIWWSAQNVGGPYNPAAGQSGMGTTNATYVAAGKTQTVLGRQLTRLYAINDRSLYISHDGGITWADELAAPLDMGATFFAEYKAIYGDYPPNDVGAMGNTAAAASSVQNNIELLGHLPPPFDPALTDTGGSGRTVPIPFGNAFYCPPGWVIACRLTSRNGRTYRLLDTESPAPYNAIKLAEAVEIAADDSRGVVTASGQLLVGAFRFLAQANRAQLVRTVYTQASTQEAALWKLLVGDQVLLDQTVAYVGADGVTTTTLCDFRNQPMYVYDIAMATNPQTGVAEFTLQVCNSVAFMVLDLMAILAGVAGSQAKDRRLKNVRIR